MIRPEIIDKHLESVHYLKRLLTLALPSGEGGRLRPGEGYTGWRRRRRVGVEEATFVRRSHFCRGRGALFTLIRHGKRATFPKGEGKAKITFK